jgi:2-aminoethylphosphonate transport system permease protein
MLVWSRSGKLAVWGFAALLVGVAFLAPLAVILAASFAGQWNGVLPSGFTFEHFAQSGGGASGEAVFASLATGVVASLLALISGAWAALALRSQGGGAARTLGVLFCERSACYSSCRALCRRFRSGSACSSPSASGRCCSTARRRSSSSLILC